MLCAGSYENCIMLERNLSQKAIWGMYDMTSDE